MPFTPFHMGPGAALKALGGKYFSLSVFGFSQVMMDVEPLVRIIRGDDVVHGYTHTYPGAFLIAVFSLLFGKPICEWLLRFWNHAVTDMRIEWMKTFSCISWRAAVTGAVTGTFSHVWLDSIMHSDMNPFTPFSDANGLLLLMPVGELYLLCVVLGIAGVTSIGMKKVWQSLSAAAGKRGST